MAKSNISYYKKYDVMTSYGEKGMVFLTLANYRVVLGITRTSVAMGKMHCFLNVFVTKIYKKNFYIYLFICLSFIHLLMCVHVLTFIFRY